MKQYIMGMITGASLIACLFMFVGATNQGNGKYQAFYRGEIKTTQGGNHKFESCVLLDTSTGEMYELKGAWGAYQWYPLNTNFKK